MLAENIVVKGEFFQTVREKDSVEQFKSIKRRLIDYFSSKGYMHYSPDSYSFLYHYAELEFWISIPHKQKKQSWFPSKKSQIPSYSDILKKTRNSVPWCVKVYIFPEKRKDYNILKVEIITEPAFFYKVDQNIIENCPLNQDDYSFIIYKNKEFIEGVSKANLLSTINPPKVLNEYIQTEVSRKIRNYGFTRVSEILEKGRNEVEFGKSENGLLDLRSALEIFLFKLIEELGEIPHSQDKVKANIDKLSSLGYFDNGAQSLLTKIMYSGIYNFLSDGPNHKRKTMNLFDSRLCFNITEQFFDYCLDKIIIYKSK